PLATIAGCGPSIPTLGKMEVERCAPHAPDTRSFALVAVGIKHQPAIPRGGNADDVFGAPSAAEATSTRGDERGRSSIHVPRPIRAFAPLFSCGCGSCAAAVLATASENISAMNELHSAVNTRP